MYIMNFNKDYVLLILIVLLVFYILRMQQDKLIQNNIFNKKLLMFRTLIDEYKLQIDKEMVTCPSCSNVCPKCPSCPSCSMPLSDNELVSKRDTAVVTNPLYPPLNRVPKPMATDYLRYKREGVFDYPTRNGNDTYKLMAYLINSTDKTDKWNVYGRQKYAGSSQGEFYATQQCIQNTCTKIEITKDIIVGNYINDYYNLPNILTFNSPLFSTEPYDVVQLKTANGQSIYF